MSRAFVKEDAEIAERATRRRSASGLPPGALNYLTADGAEELRKQLAKLRNLGEPGAATISQLEEILASATIVDPPARPKVVVFGTTVTLRAADGSSASHRIVGVDEVNLHPGGVSWASPIGRALLGAEVGSRVFLAPTAPATVLRIE